MSVAENAGPPASHVVMHVATKSAAWIASWRTAAIFDTVSDEAEAGIEAVMKRRDPEAAFAGLEAERMAEAAQSLGIAGRRMESAQPATETETETGSGSGYLDRTCVRRGLSTGR